MMKTKKYNKRKRKPEEKFAINAIIGCTLASFAIIAIGSTPLSNNSNNSFTASPSDYIAGVQFNIPDDLNDEELNNLEIFNRTLTEWEQEINDSIPIPRYIDLFMEGSESQTSCTYFGYYLDSAGEIIEFKEEKSFNFQLTDDLSAFSGNPEEEVSPSMIFIIAE